MRKTTAIFFLMFSLVQAQTDPISWTKHVITDSLSGAKKIVAVNLDNDVNRSMDIVISANPEGNGIEDENLVNIAWFRNNGNEQFTQYNIDMKHVGARGLAVGDLTGNGYADIIAGSRQADSSLILYKNDGTPHIDLWERIKIGGPAPNDYSVHIVDLDRDGLLDIVDGMGDDADNGSANSGTISDSLRWFRNLGGGSNVEFQVELIASYSSPAGIAIADFNEDNYLDVAGAAWIDYYLLSAEVDEDIRWWKMNPDTSFSQQSVLQQMYGANDLTAVDMNGDGAIDLLAAGYKTQQIDWFSNDGSGSFGPIQNVTSDFKYTRNVSAADLDGDGDMDITAAADTDNKISWFENNGQQSFSEHKVDSLFHYAYFSLAQDLDGDGDTDIIGTAQDDGVLAWWENNLAEDKMVTAGDPAPVSFNSDSVIIDFINDFSGGQTSVFYNHGLNPNQTQVGPGLKSVVLNGFYTIYTKAAAYQADIEFNYNLSEWRGNIENETDLRICSQDENGFWVIIGDSGQTVDSQLKTITVKGIEAELHKYSRFTLGEKTPVSAILSGKGKNNALRFTLAQNYPNPFNRTTIIPVSLSKSTEKATLQVYDLLGRKIKTIYSGSLSAGVNIFRWNGSDDMNRAVASGVYFYRLQIDNRSFSKRLILSE